MAKQLLYDKDARAKLIAGIDAVAKAVVTTLGPKGRNVALDKKWGAPSVVHDGVTVAKEIELQDPFENMGAQLIKEAASKTNDVSGDGTTTSTILTQEIVHQGLSLIQRGADPMEMVNELRNGVNKVVAKIKEMAKPVKGKDEITQVATVAAQDPEIGRMIAEAIEKVGKDGVLTVEEGKGLTLEIEYKEGMEFDKGYASPYFVTNPEQMEAELEDPHILITDKKISAISDLLPFLEKLIKVSKNLVIIADEIEGEALATLVVNKLRGTFNCLAIKAPGFGDRRKEMLEDIAVLTGGTVISEDTGRKLENVTLEDCGQAEKVWADKENCRLIGGKGSKTAIKARIEQIRRELAATTSEFDKEKLQERLAKLSGGVAVLQVGAATEIELKEKQERVKDAVEATKAAIEEGIVSGGGISLLRAREVLAAGRVGGAQGDTKTERRFHGSPGWTVLYQSLDAPLRGILSNATPGWSEIFQAVLWGDGSPSVGKGKLENYGYDVVREEYGDMFEKGIVDPAKVVRTALQNAASVAVMILTTEALVTDIVEKKETPPMPGGGMGEY